MGNTMALHIELCRLAKATMPLGWTDHPSQLPVGEPYTIAITRVSIQPCPRFSYLLCEYAKEKVD